MRTTVTLEDTQLAAAREYLGDLDTSSLIKAALKALIEREAARRLALLGGSQPDFDVPPRRRSAI